MNYKIDYLYILSYRLYKKLEQLREKTSHLDTQDLEENENIEINKMLEELKILASKQENI